MDQYGSSTRQARFQSYRDWVSARFYTPRWKLVGIVVIFTKGENRKERIWETHWLNGTIIYRTLLDNLLEFKKGDCVLVAIKFDIEITTVVNKWKVASILSPYVQARKSKVKMRNKHVEADQKQQVVDCGTKRAWKTDTSGAAKCVPLYLRAFARLTLMYKCVMYIISLP